MSPLGYGLQNEIVPTETLPRKVGEANYSSMLTLAIGPSSYGRYLMFLVDISWNSYVGAIFMVWCVLPSPSPAVNSWIPPLP